MSEAVRYERRDGMAVVTLDAPGEKVNVLTSAFLAALEQMALRLAAEEGLRGAVVVSAKSGGFIAGADIEAIAAVRDPATGTALAREGQRIFGLWATLPFPVIAAVNGHCLGGGTEFALACRYRIAAPDAAIGLPEVRLGIFPGFGGTQRLPRLIGIAPALDMILTGRNIRSEEALKKGLIDRIAEGDLVTEGLALALEAILHPARLEERRMRRRPWQQRALEGNPLGRAVLFAQVRRETLKKTEGRYPAPLRAMEVVRRGLALPLGEALELEARELGPLIVSETCKNLIHVYFLSQRAKKARFGARPSEVRKIAVLGAGVMGGGIAQLLAAKDLPVVLKDIRPEALEAGLETARAAFRRRGREGGETERRMSLIAATTDYAKFADVDLAIEAVVEKMAVKQSVLREAEEHLPEHAVFATNTSALSVTQLQEVATRPERVGGLHFFNPVHRMPLVEVIRGERTGDATVATLLAVAQRLGKTPILVADRPGFLVNRLLGIYLNEAALLAREGIDWTSLDRLARQFGWPMGPFRLVDEVGIDIAAEVGTTLAAAFPYIPECDLFRKAAESGRKGKKGGGGFYRYREKHSSGPDPAVERTLGLKRQRSAREEDLKRMLYLMVNEAARCLEDGVVADPADVDTGMVFGAGFPPFRGGLCRWADREGIPTVRRFLKELSDLRGERFEPCAFLAGREAFYPASEGAV